MDRKKEKIISQKEERGKRTKRKRIGREKRMSK